MDSQILIHIALRNSKPRRHLKIINILSLQKKKKTIGIYRITWQEGKNKREKNKRIALSGNVCNKRRIWMTFTKQPRKKIRTKSCHGNQYRRKERVAHSDWFCRIWACFQFSDHACTRNNERQKAGCVDLILNVPKLKRIGLLEMCNTAHICRMKNSYESVVVHTDRLYSVDKDAVGSWENSYAVILM